jgi:uncharacterized protein YjbI with pentapeptide repeats
MIKLITLLKEINLDQARFYMGLDRTIANKVINPLWKFLESKADSISRNGERLFFYFDETTKLKDEIETLVNRYVDDKGSVYKLLDFEKGKVLKTVKTERGLKDVEIGLGKVLQIISKTNPYALQLLNTYNVDAYARSSKSQKDRPVIVISKHPVDLANMSTDRSWSNCMSLSTAGNSEGGTNKRYIECDVQQGTLIVYLLPDSSNLKSVQHAQARVLIKPYYKEDTDELVMSPGRLYGDAPTSFITFIEDLIKSSNLYKTAGLFKLQRDLYTDNVPVVSMGQKSISGVEFTELIKTNRYVNLLDYNLSKLVVRNDILEDAVLEKLYIRNSVFVDIVFSKGSLTNTEFYNCKFNGVVFNHIDLNKTSFIDCTFNDVDFSNGIFKETTIDRSKLSNTTFEGADLRDDVNFEGSIFNSTVNFNQAKLDRVTFWESIVEDVDFSKALGMTDMYCRTGFFSNNKTLIGKDLSKGVFYGAYFVNTDLQYVKFIEADLEKADFKNANLLKTNLKGANLKDAKNLNMAKNINTVIYDNATIWPDGFDINEY